MEEIMSKYIKEVFNSETLEQAKNTCLTFDASDPNKFENETRFLVDFLKQYELLNKDSLVLDYGCGVGRVSKMIIDDIGCRIAGVDISESMLQFATQYVNNENFLPLLYTKELSNNAPKFDLVIASLVLQHTEDPIESIKFIKDILKEGGTFVLVNEGTRYVPTNVDSNGYVVWHDDGINILEEVGKQFNLVGQYQYYTRTDYPLSVWKK